MGYEKHLIKKLEKAWSELDHLLQEGAVFNFKEKEKLLGVLNDIEKLVDEFNTY